MKNHSFRVVAVAALTLVCGFSAYAITPEYPSNGWTPSLDASGQMVSLAYNIPADTKDAESQLAIQLDGKAMPISGVFTYRDGIKRAANPQELKIYWALYSGPHFVWEYLVGQSKTVSAQPSVTTISQEFLGQQVRLIISNGHEYFGALTRMQLGPDWLYLDINGTPVGFYAQNIKEVQRLK
jgi:hypothetical protein